MNVYMHITYTYIYSVSYLSSVHILIFLKDLLKEKEMLSIESDRFPQVLLCLLTATDEPSLLILTSKRKERIKNNLSKKQKSLNENIIVSARDVVKMSYPKILIGPIYTSKHIRDLIETSRVWTGSLLVHPFRDCPLLSNDFQNL